MSDGSGSTASASAAQMIASALVALGFLALVAIIFWRATEPGQNFDKIWAATGSIVGVAVGAIPSFSSSVRYALNAPAHPSWQIAPLP